MFKPKRIHLLVFLIFILLTFIVTWPLILKPAQITVAGREEFFLSYILNWNIQALTHYPLQIFQVPFFHPLKNALAFSDPLFTSALIALPFVKLFNQPFLAYSVNILIAFVLNGFFTYLMVYRLTKKALPALVSGVLLAFSIGRIDTLEHLQVFAIYWIPLGLYFFLKLIDTKLHRYALLISLCFLLQILNAVFLGYVYALILICFTLVYNIKKKLQRPQLFLVIKYFLLSLIIVTCLFFPYFNVSKTWQYSRSVKDIWGGSIYLPEYLYPTHNSNLESLAQKIIYKQPWPAYMGAAVSALGLMALINSSFTPFKLSILIASLTGFVFSLGPYLQLTKHGKYIPLPLPYLIAFYLVPGFKSMRTPQRWSHLLLFGFSILAGLFLTKLYQRLKPTYQKLITFLIIVIVILEIRLPIFTHPVSTAETIPTVYRWLSLQPPSTIIEIPAQSWVMKLSSQEIFRLHYHSFFLSAEHKFVNGFSGFEPPAWMDDITILRKFPQQKSLAKLRELKVDTVILHHEEMADLKLLDQETISLDEVLITLAQQPDFKIVYQDPQTTAYTILPLPKSVTPQSP